MSQEPSSTTDEDLVSNSLTSLPIASLEDLQNAQIFQERLDLINPVQDPLEPIVHKEQHIPSYSAPPIVSASTFIGYQKFSRDTYLPFPIPQNPVGQMELVRRQLLNLPPMISDESLTSLIESESQQLKLKNSPPVENYPLLEGSEMLVPIKAVVPGYDVAPAAESRHWKLVDDVLYTTARRAYDELLAVWALPPLIYRLPAMRRRLIAEAITAAGLDSFVESTSKGEAWANGKGSMATEVSTTFYDPTIRSGEAWVPGASINNVQSISNISSFRSSNHENKSEAVNPSPFDHLTSSPRKQLLLHQDSQMNIIRPIKAKNDEPEYNIADHNTSQRNSSPRRIVSAGTGHENVITPVRAMTPSSGRQRTTSGNSSDNDPHSASRRRTSVIDQRSASPGHQYRGDLLHESPLSFVDEIGANGRNRAYSNDLSGRHRTFSNDMSGRNRTFSIDVYGRNRTFSNDMSGRHRTYSNDLSGTQPTYSSNISNCSSPQQVVSTSVGTTIVNHNNLNAMSTLLETGECSTHASSSELLTKSLTSTIIGDGIVEQNSVDNGLVMMVPSNSDDDDDEWSFVIQSTSNVIGTRPITVPPLGAILQETDPEVREMITTYLDPFSVGWYTNTDNNGEVIVRADGTSQEEDPLAGIGGLAWAEKLGFLSKLSPREDEEGVPFVAYREDYTEQQSRLELQRTYESSLRSAIEKRITDPTDIESVEDVLADIVECVAVAVEAEEMMEHQQEMDQLRQIVHPAVSQSVFEPLGGWHSDEFEAPMDENSSIPQFMELSGPKRVAISDIALPDLVITKGSFVLSPTVSRRLLLQHAYERRLLSQLSAVGNEIYNSSDVSEWFPDDFTDPVDRQPFSKRFRSAIAAAYGDMASVSRRLLSDVNRRLLALSPSSFSLNGSVSLVAKQSYSALASAFSDSGSLAWRTAVEFAQATEARRHPHLKLLQRLTLKDMVDEVERNLSKNNENTNNSKSLVPRDCDSDQFATVAATAAKEALERNGGSKRSSLPIEAPFPLPDSLILQLTLLTPAPLPYVRRPVIDINDRIQNTTTEAFSRLAKSISSKKKLPSVEETATSSNDVTGNDNSVYASTLTELRSRISKKTSLRQSIQPDDLILLPKNMYRSHGASAKWTSNSDAGGKWIMDYSDTIDWKRALLEELSALTGLPLSNFSVECIRRRCGKDEEIKMTIENLSRRKAEARWSNVLLTLENAVKQAVSVANASGVDITAEELLDESQVLHNIISLQNTGCGDGTNSCPDKSIDPERSIEVVEAALNAQFSAINDCVNERLASPKKRTEKFSSTQGKKINDADFATLHSFNSIGLCNPTDILADHNHWLQRTTAKSTAIAPNELSTAERDEKLRQYRIFNALPKLSATYARAAAVEAAGGDTQSLIQVIESDNIPPNTMSSVKELLSDVKDRWMTWLDDLDVHADDALRALQEASTWQSVDASMEAIDAAVRLLTARFVKYSSKLLTAAWNQCGVAVNHLSDILRRLASIAATTALQRTRAHKLLNLENYDEACDVVINILVRTEQRSLVPGLETLSAMDIAAYLDHLLCSPISSLGINSLSKVSLQNAGPRQLLSKLVGVKFSETYTRIPTFPTWSSFFVYILHPSFFGYSTRRKGTHAVTGDWGSINGKKKNTKLLESEKELSALLGVTLNTDGISATSVISSEYLSSLGLSLASPLDLLSYPARSLLKVLNERPILPSPEEQAKLLFEEKRRRAALLSMGISPDDPESIEEYERMLQFQQNQNSTDLSVSVPPGLDNFLSLHESSGLMGEKSMISLQRGGFIPLYRPNMKNLTAGDLRQLRAVYRTTVHEMEIVMKAGLINNSLRPNQYEALKRSQKALRLWKTARHRFRVDKASQLEIHSETTRYDNPNNKNDPLLIQIAEAAQFAPPRFRATHVSKEEFEAWLEEVRQEDRELLIERRLAAEKSKAALQRELRTRRRALKTLHAAYDAFLDSYDIYRPKLSVVRTPASENTNSHTDEFSNTDGASALAYLSQVNLGGKNGYGTPNFDWFAESFKGLQWRLSGYYEFTHDSFELSTALHTAIKNAEMQTELAKSSRGVPLNASSVAQITGNSGAVTDSDAIKMASHAVIERKKLTIGEEKRARRVFDFIFQVYKRTHQQSPQRFPHNSHGDGFVSAKSQMVGRLRSASGFSDAGEMYNADGLTFESRKWGGQNPAENKSRPTTAGTMRDLIGRDGHKNTEIISYDEQPLDSRQRLPRWFLLSFLDAALMVLSREDVETHVDRLLAEESGYGRSNFNRGAKYGFRRNIHRNSLSSSNGLSPLRVRAITGGGKLDFAAYTEGSSANESPIQSAREVNSGEVEINETPSRKMSISLTQRGNYLDTPVTRRGSVMHSPDTGRSSSGNQSRRGSFLDVPLSVFNRTSQRGFDVDNSVTSPEGLFPKKRRLSSLSLDAQKSRLRTASDIDYVHRNAIPSPLASRTPKAQDTPNGWQWQTSEGIDFERLVRPQDWQAFRDVGWVMSMLRHPPLFRVLAMMTTSDGVGLPSSDGLLNKENLQSLGAGEWIERDELVMFASISVPLVAAIDSALEFLNNKKHAAEVESGAKQIGRLPEPTLLAAKRLLNIGQPGSGLKAVSETINTDLQRPPAGGNNDDGGLLVRDNDGIDKSVVQQDISSTAVIGKQKILEEVAIEADRQRAWFMAHVHRFISPSDPNKPVFCIVCLQRAHEYWLTTFSRSESEWKTPATTSTLPFAVTGDFESSMISGSNATFEEYRSVIVDSQADTISEKVNTIYGDLLREEAKSRALTSLRNELGDSLSDHPEFQNILSGIPTSTDETIESIIDDNPNTQVMRNEICGVVNEDRHQCWLREQRLLRIALDRLGYHSKVDGAGDLVLQDSPPQDITSAIEVDGSSLMTGAAVPYVTLDLWQQATGQHADQLKSNLSSESDGNSNFQHETSLITVLQSLPNGIWQPVENINTITIRVYHRNSNDERADFLGAAILPPSFIRSPPRGSRTIPLNMSETLGDQSTSTKINDVEKDGVTINRRVGTIAVHLHHHITSSGKSRWKFRIDRLSNLPFVGEEFSESYPTAFCEVWWRGLAVRKGVPVVTSNWSLVGITVSNFATNGRVEYGSMEDQSSVFDLPPKWTSLPIPQRGPKGNTTISGGAFVSKNHHPQPSSSASQVYALLGSNEDVSSRANALLEAIEQRTDSIYLGLLAAAIRTETLAHTMIVDLEEKERTLMAAEERNTRVVDFAIESHLCTEAIAIQEHHATHFQRVHDSIVAPGTIFSRLRFLMGEEDDAEDRENKLVALSFSKKSQFSTDDPPVVVEGRRRMTALAEINELILNKKRVKKSKASGATDVRAQGHGNSFRVRCQDPATGDLYVVVCTTLIQEEDESNMLAAVLAISSRQSPGLLRIVESSIHSADHFNSSGFVATHEKISIVITEFYDGPTFLTWLLSRWDEVTDAEFRALLAQISSALATMHEENVIHRNFSPQAVAVAGVGLSSISTATRQRKNNSSSQKQNRTTTENPTGARLILGDYWFLQNPRRTACRRSLGRADWGAKRTAPPEVFSNSTATQPGRVGNVGVSPASDIFAFGACVYYWATQGHYLPSFDRLSSSSLMGDLSGIRATLPTKFGGWLLSLLRMCLAINPNSRATAADITAFLRNTKLSEN